MEGRISGCSSLDTPQRNVVEVNLDRTHNLWCTSLKAAWHGSFFRLFFFFTMVKSQQ
jgi:hypothetical protein